MNWLQPGQLVPMYKMLKRLDNNLDWHEIKRKLEKVYSPMATEVHTASAVHCKQRPDVT